MRILLLFLSLFFWLGDIKAADLTRFEEANAKYEAQNFKEVAMAYEELVREGKAGTAVYYNLGNAYFRLGQKGKALASYERALAISPGDRDTRWNLDIVKSALPDRIQALPENIVVDWIKQMTEPVPVNQINLFFTAGLLLFFGFAVLNFIFPGIKRWVRFFQVLTVLALMVLGALFFVKWREVKDPRIVVLDKEVYAHYGPSNKETKAFLLHEGAEGKVLDETGDWFYIVLKNKNSGWIPKGSCEIV